MPKNLEEALELITRLKTPDKQPIDTTLIPNLSIRLTDLASRDWVHKLPFGRATLARLCWPFSYVCEVVSKTPEDILRYRTIGPKKLAVLEQILAHLGLQLGYHLEEKGSWWNR